MGLCPKKKYTFTAPSSTWTHLHRAMPTNGDQKQASWQLDCLRAVQLALGSQITKALLLSTQSTALASIYLAAPVLISLFPPCQRSLIGE